MSGTIKTGGPAFPLTEDAVSHKCRDFDMQGMTLRDYFAGKALSTMAVKDNGAYSQCDLDRKTPENDCRYLAVAAYRMADAMIAAREA